MIKMNSIPPTVKDSVALAVTKLFDTDTNIILGGLHCNTNRLAEDILRKYTETPCVLTSSGTTALMISFEYAIHLAGNRPIELYVSEFLYFSIASLIQNSGYKVNVLKSEVDEVTLSQAVVNQETFNIFILTSHNNKNANVATVVSESPKDRTFIIEDRCVVMGNQVTNDVDVACYSFSNNKMIVAGEGGCVSSKHQDFLEWARMRTFSGIVPSNDNPSFMYLGNYQISKIKSPFKCSANAFVGAMINAQIPVLEDHLSQRRQIYNIMYSRLNFSEHQMPTPHAPLFYPLQLPNSISNRQVKVLQMSALKQGISTYIGVLPYEYYSTDNHDKKIISLPVHTNLTSSDVGKIVDVIGSKLKEYDIKNG
jgi:dTDP-4-amino-4,6-dideoxygalactose transaminase